MYGKISIGLLMVNYLVLLIKPRFKPAPSNETLDFIAKARTEVTTNRQTNLGVKLFQGTKG
jgi:hypothetical protein